MVCHMHARQVTPSYCSRSTICKHLIEASVKIQPFQYPVTILLQLNRSMSLCAQCVALSNIRMQFIYVYHIISMCSSVISPQARETVKVLRCLPVFGQPRFYPQRSIDPWCHMIPQALPEADPQNSQICPNLPPNLKRPE